MSDHDPFLRSALGLPDTQSTPRSELFETAVRAGCNAAFRRECDYPHCLKSEYPCNLTPLTINATLAAALPPDLTPEMLEAMTWGEYDVEDAIYAYKRLRAILLPGEEQP